MNLKVPALEKLVEYTASGMGAVAGPMLAPLKARREAEARLIEWRADADSLKLIAGAQAEARRSLAAPDQAGRTVLEFDRGGVRQRLEFQERQQQASITSVALEAAAGLGDREVPAHEPDPDWTARFFEGVQNVSSADMRKIWGKILSGEVKEPGRSAASSPALAGSSRLPSLIMQLFDLRHEFTSYFDIREHVSVGDHIAVYPRA